jgi:hypothetical protein
VTRMSTEQPTPNRRLWIAVVVLALVASVAGGYAIQLRTAQRDDAQQEAATNAKGKVQVAGEGQMLANEVLAACRAGGDESAALSKAGLCGKASTAKENIDERVKDTPSSSSTTTTIVRRETVPMATLTTIVRAAIDEALVASCGADGCRDGRDSTVPGPVSTVPGPASTVPGPRGPQGEKGDTPSDDTILALIRRLLAENPPKDGQDGRDGRGITSLACSATLGPITFTVTYTDGTTQEFSCGDAPVDPDPDPVATDPAP